MKNKTFIGALLLGIGTIGMLDGILFHQLLQWHSVYMDTDRRHQIMSDGLFHLAVTVVVTWGALLLWRSEDENRTLLISGLLIGAGAFNFMEGMIDHHLLQIHHVRPGPYQLPYDLAYDALGLLITAAGVVLLRRSERARV